ncbi:MAG TPA: hypothetical protein VGG03_00330 [Thermoanaerobaculia bacterium]|jgi:hypothetical protein
MRLRPLPLLLLFLIAIPVFADDVYLVNGGKFEGVIAETTASQVRIRMQGGVLSLPKSQVLRVEEGDTNLSEFLRRKEALKKNGSARDWLELSRWAKDKELGQAARESALAAAALDPHLPGLAPILRGYGYVLDEQLDRWIPYADSMRRRGFVLSNGQWITREEYAAKVRAREEEEARLRAIREERARAVREDRLAALTELTLARDLSRQAASSAPVYPVLPFYGPPVVLLPGFWVAPVAPRPPHRFGPPRGFTHVPGSLIPGDLFPETH